MKKGFTLIEMLVVVLIIGVLAAVAVPQYESAIEKSRVAEALVVMKSLVDAEQRYLQANPNEPGACTRKDIADVDLKGGTWTDGGSNVHSNGTDRGISCDSYKTKYFIYDLGDGEKVTAYRTDNNSRTNIIYKFWFGPDTLNNKDCWPDPGSTDGDEDGRTMCQFIKAM